MSIRNSIARARHGAGAPSASAVLTFGSLSIGLVYFAWIARVALESTHFIGDDLLSFLWGRTMPLPEFLLTPIDVHPVPAHRLVSYAVNALWPLDYRPALMVLAAFHGLGLAALYAVLEEVEESPLNGFLVAVYGVNLYLSPLLLWWTAGLHRLPYVAGSLLAVWLYLRFRRSGRLRDAAGVGVAMVVALGFYPKAALVPLVLVGLDVALGSHGAGARARTRLVVLATLALLCAGYSALWSSLVDPRAQALNTSAAFQLDFQIVSWKILSLASLGRLYDPRDWLAALGAMP
jgi:hypothetical protein